jgi:AraC family transcriptional regulator, regulatory protein of adaptative response / DNA-3-methyladenine glycosylase II
VCFYPKSPQGRLNGRADPVFAGGWTARAGLYVTGTINPVPTHHFSSDDEVRKALDGHTPSGQYRRMDLNHDACYRVIALRDARFDGRFFTAVKTTGVYCRPICPARTPLSDNVTFYPTAAAAHAAGFRPCLRCRPETAPDTGAWRGTSSTASRALALIELGALDEGGVDALAGRLGVGERQLRRLCRRHLGVSPVAVAQTRRVLLAKQLIHETSLPMTEVAFASGFGSIRRFNETFLALYGRAPCTLRRGSGPEIPAGPGGEISLRLRYQPPYDWSGMLESLRLRAIPRIERVGESSYSRSIELEGRQGIVRVRSAEDNALRVSIRFPKLSALPGIIARLRRVFDLAADPLPIAAHLAKDPVLAPLVAARPGLRVPGAWDGFELAIRAVLGQQITVGAAVRLAGRLVARHGEPLAEPGRDLTHVFPRPEVVALADLTTLGMPRSRAATLSAVAAAVAAEPDLLCAGRGLDEAIQRLRSIRGVGEWTAQYIALRQLREPDAFPAADIGERGWQALWRRERRPAAGDERPGIRAGPRQRRAPIEQHGRDARL